MTTDHTVLGGGGIRLHVEEVGPRDAPPILFLHGFSSSGQVWCKQTESGLAREFRLVTLDLRGHGQSEKPRDAYGDSRLWAEDIQAVIETLELDHPLLVGASYGALAACDYLRFQGEDQIRGLHLVGGMTTLGTEEALAALGTGFLPLVPGLFSNQAEESIEALENFARLCLGAKTLPADLCFLLGCSALVPPYVRQGLFSRRLINDDLLACLQKPVLIAQGEQDRFVCAESACRHAALIPGSSLSWYAQTGHCPFWEASDRFNHELARFAQMTARNGGRKTHRCKT